jgi:hypothetical protein
VPDLSVPLAALVNGQFRRSGDLPAASLTAAAAVMRRDGSNSVVPALSAGAGSASWGGGGAGRRKTIHGSCDGGRLAGLAAIDETARCVRRSVLIT